MAGDMLDSNYLMNASAISSVTAGDFPASGSSREKLEFALKYAALAPTESGWQPWYFRLSDTYVELMIKNSPTQEAVDPERREFMIGCGSALLHLKLALKHFGCLGRLALFPDLGQPALVARIHFGLCGGQGAQERLLFEAMTENRANVSPLGETPISEAMLEALGHAAAGERGWLDFVQSEMSWQVIKTTLAVGRRWPDLPSRPRLQFTFTNRNVHSWDKETEPIQRPGASAVTLAVVKTKTDDKHGWLEAGQTMARTLLQAQALRMSWAFFNPVRRREAREALRIGVGHKGFAQVILQFGSRHIQMWNGAVNQFRQPAVPVVRLASHDL
jgi:hypothetical protein